MRLQGKWALGGLNLALTPRLPGLCSSLNPRLCLSCQKASDLQADAELLDSGLCLGVMTGHILQIAFRDKTIWAVHCLLLRATVVTAQNFVSRPGGRQLADMQEQLQRYQRLLLSSAPRLPDGGKQLQAKIQSLEDSIAVAEEHHTSTITAMQSGRDSDAQIAPAAQGPKLHPATFTSNNNQPIVERAPGCNAEAAGPSLSHQHHNRAKPDLGAALHDTAHRETAGPTASREVEGVIRDKKIGTTEQPAGSGEGQSSNVGPKDSRTGGLQHPHNAVLDQEYKPASQPESRDGDSGSLTRPTQALHAGLDDNIRAMRMSEDEQHSRDNQRQPAKRAIGRLDGASAASAGSRAVSQPQARAGAAKLTAAIFTPFPGEPTAAEAEVAPSSTAILSET